MLWDCWIPELKQLTTPLHLDTLSKPFYQCHWHSFPVPSMWLFKGLDFTIRLRVTLTSTGAHTSSRSKAMSGSVHCQWAWYWQCHSTPCQKLNKDWKQTKPQMLCSQWFMPCLTRGFQVCLKLHQGSSCSSPHICLDAWCGTRTPQHLSHTWQSQSHLYPSPTWKHCYVKPIMRWLLEKPHLTPLT